MIAFNLGGLEVHRYGIFYFVSFIVWYFFLRYIGKTKLFKNRPKLQNILEKGSEDIILYALLWILIGGRLWHILIYGNGYYFSHLGEMLQIWKGWMSFIGSMIGVGVAFLIFRKIKKLDRTEFLLLFDCILAIVPFGIMIGRLGNFFNQELYGIVVGPLLPKLWYPLFSILNDLHVFHVYPAVDEFLRINTNFLSMFFEGFAILVVTLSIMYHWIKNKRYRTGQIAGIFLVMYSTIRFVLEYLRADSQEEFIGMLTKSQWFFVFFFLLGLFFLLRKYILRRHKNTPRSSKARKLLSIF